MTVDRLQQIEALYNDALAVAPNERAAFLDRACGGDKDLRGEVDSLLAYQQKAQTYMETGAIHEAAQSLARERAGVLVNRMLGRYHLLSLVGQGGMGEIYCAVDTRLNRLVAVKVLPTYMAADSVRLERFEEEARAVAALNHSHICTLHDVGNDEGLHYLVFEYLAGEPLSDRLSKSGLALPEALKYADQIADALAYSHEHGVIHLDLKPDNIMLIRSGVKLVDFGIAELRHPDEPTSSAAARGARGTVGYMAPEQVAGGETDARTDIFAFGVVMFEMFTGLRAFQRNSRSAAVAASAHSENPPRISDVASGVPPALDFLVERCLAQNPSERWQSVSELLSKLREIGDRRTHADLALGLQ